MPATYCNPLPLPDYPRGVFANAKGRQEPEFFWDRTTHPDYREAADPSVLFHEGKWFLYLSGSMAWVSEDFVTWRHHPINVPWIGYAPTIVRHRGRFLLTACDAPIHSAADPLGPFEPLGPMTLPDGAPLKGWLDPMLFSDDDGRLFAYWGIHTGIFAAELDAEHPTCLLAPPSLLFNYNPAHAWERSGEHGQFDGSFVEGAWMVKIAGRYFLTYCAPGTELRAYGMGCYVGDSPLGPFRYQSRNPILQDPHGLVAGPGHGCIVAGPGGTHWAFYTCTARVNHWFERRIGLDPAGLDANGNLFVLGASDSPQLAPGARPAPWLGNDAGLVPVTPSQRARATSNAPGRDPFYAVDQCHHTWWEAAPGDRAPALELFLFQPIVVQAMRVWWREPGLAYDEGRVPGPYGYRVEGRLDDKSPWQVLLDASDNPADLLIDYREFAPSRVARLRLVVTRSPEGLGVGVVDFTAFGPPNVA